MFYQFIRALDRIEPDGLTTESHGWLSPNRYPLYSFVSPASPGFIGNPFLLDPESILRVALLSISEFDRGQEAVRGQSDLQRQ